MENVKKAMDKLARAVELVEEATDLSYGVLNIVMITEDLRSNEWQVIVTESSIDEISRIAGVKPVMTEKSGSSEIWSLTYKGVTFSVFRHEVQYE